MRYSQRRGRGFESHWLHEKKLLQSLVLQTIILLEGRIILLSIFIFKAIFAISFFIFLLSNPFLLRQEKKISCRTSFLKGDFIMSTSIKINRNGKVFYTIRSRYVFNEVMRDESTCLEFLRLVFPELHIQSIRTNSEQTMENHLGKRGIRLDIYIEEQGASRIIDLEMQVADYPSELPKRTRYYSSTIDGWLLKKNEDYEKLCDTIVLFICPFDPFGRGQKIYTFENICKEEPSLTLQDGQQVRFLNTVGVRGSISAELQAVFDYITSDDGETEDRFAKKLKEMVAEINADKERMGVVMTFEQEVNRINSVWKDKLDEKEALLEQNAALLEQNAISLEQKDSQLHAQAQLIEDLQKQIEALKKG